MLQIFVTFGRITYFNRTVRFETRMLFVQEGMMRRIVEIEHGFPLAHRPRDEKCLGHFTSILGWISLENVDPSNDSI